jgi:hypothetical protein
MTTYNVLVILAISHNTRKDFVDLADSYILYGYVCLDISVIS